MTLSLMMKIEHSIRALRPSRFASAVADAPFIDIQSLVPSTSRVVVIAPHPDDEVIGCGGIMMAAAGQGNPIVVIGVTDGEECYSSSPQCTPQQLAAMRRAESMEALRRLGVLPDAVHRLGLPDGEVRKHGGRLTQQLCRLLQPDDIVITTWRRDGHADHKAVGQHAAEAAAARGARLIEVPIWAWQWPFNETVPADGEHPYRIALDTRAEVRKEYALSAYASQVRPPAPLPSNPALPQQLIGRWLRGWETVIL